MDIISRKERSNVNTLIIVLSVSSRIAKCQQRILKLREDTMRKRKPKNRMDRLAKTEIIITLALIAPLYMLFIEHDELFMLFLLEISFMAVIGLMFFIMVWTALKISEWIQRILERWLR